MKKWDIGWGTISACNMHCAFCYSEHKRKNCLSLKFEDWKKFVDENYLWINSINYGTGENTLSKDWFRLTKYIRENYPAIRQSLTTNGNLAVAAKDNFCYESFAESIDEVDVSLDFCDKEKHDAFRGLPNAYDNALAALKLCQTLHKTTTIVVLGSKLNLSESNLEGLFRIAENYDAILRTNIFRPTAGINSKTEKFILTYEEIKNIFEYVAKNHQIISLGDTLFSAIFTNTPRKDPSGQNSLRILADGSITPSTYLISENFFLDNIKSENVLKNIGENFKLKNLFQPTVPAECKNCYYEKNCGGGVKDRRFLWYNTLERKDPYCPKFFKGKNANLFEVKKCDFKSVHEKYLPTIFFKA